LFLQIENTWETLFWVPGKRFYFGSPYCKENSRNKMGWHGSEKNCIWETFLSLVRKKIVSGKRFSLVRKKKGSGKRFLGIFGKKVVWEKVFGLTRLSSLLAKLSVNFSGWINRTVVHLPAHR